MSLLRAEYRKVTRRRIYPVMTLLLIAFTALAGVVFVFLSDVIPDVGDSMAGVDLYTLGLQQVVTQTWFPVILAVVLLGGELSTTVWATSLTRDARKLTQALSRFGVYAAATTVAFWVACLGWIVFIYLFAPVDGFIASSELLGVLWKPILAAIAWTSIGTAAVALLRSVGPAIGVGIAIVFAEQFLALWDVWAKISITAATSALFAVDIGGAAGAFLPATMSIWHALIVLAGWTVVGLGFTWWGLTARDA